MNKIATRSVLLACVLATSAHAGPIQFDDESDKLGFERGTESWGISWGNVNGDVWPDLYNHGHRDYTRLYRNTGNGDFDDVTLEYDVQMGLWLLALPRDVHAAALADFDNDGDDDVLIGDEDHFFVNNAESGGYFTQYLLTSPQAFAAWVPTGTWTALDSEPSCAGNYVQFIDLDVDGDLDKICGDADNFPESGSGPAASLVPTLANTIDTAVGDYNNDLRTDLMALRGAIRPNGAANLAANEVDIWFRDGTGTVATFKSSGNLRILVDGNGGGPYQEPDVIQHNSATNLVTRVRRIDFAFDAVTKLWRVTDNSGSQHYIRVRADNPLTDLTVTNLDNRDQAYPIRFGQNTAGGITWKALPGMDTPIDCTSIVTADFDNDMDLDLFMACGAGVTNSPDRYYDNNGDGSYSLVSGHGGEGPIGPGTEFGVGESVAVADYDVDGFPDVAVVNGLLFYPYGHGGPDTLIRNRGNSNRWIELDLVGTTTNRNGIGAKVYVTAGGRTQLREQNGGYHRWSQNSQRLHFGLAANAVVQEIRVVWPSGIVDVFHNVSANRLYAATEGGGLAIVPLSGTVHTSIAPGEECGQPPSHALYGPVIHLWRDCGTNVWRLRFRSGLGRMTDNANLAAVGRLVGDTNFPFANGTNLEPTDTLALTTTTQVDFSIAVRDSGTAGNKGVNFNTGSQRSTCLEFAATDFEAVIIGSLGKRLDPPFDLANGLKPCDSDGDGSNNSTDSDDDNDGVPDAQDAFPLDRTEWQDSDGDGTGDNSDAFPTDASEQTDDDGDGIGDNADMDADNDGLHDVTELLDSGFTWTTPNVQVPTDGGNSTTTINLSAQGAIIGQSVHVSALLAKGDLDASNETFSLDFNNGQFVLSQVQTEQQCAATLFPTTKPLNAIVSVIDLGGGVPGIRIKGTSSTAAGNLAECGGIGLQYRLTISAVPAYGMDEDGDSVFNLFDLDSDNDTAADVVEAGLPDLNNDYLVDDPAQQASVSTAPDTDLDGIPDFLDRESRNPANNGTDYDIAVAGRASLDSNGDGQLGPGDAGAAIDADIDGIDDLVDADPTRPGSAIPGGNHAPVAASLTAITLIDTPVSLTLSASDADGDALTFQVLEGPSNGSLTGSAPDLVYTPAPGYTGQDSFVYAASDGEAFSTPAEVQVTVQDVEQDLVSWLGAIGGVSVSANTVSYSGTPQNWGSNTVNSAALSTLGYNDDYSVRFRLLAEPTSSRFAAGLGVEETEAGWRDVDFGFRIDNGLATVRENGTWRTNGPVVHAGDALDIHVNAGTIEYRVNGTLIYTSAYAGAPVFYVDTSFNNGATAFDVTLIGVPDVIEPPSIVAVNQWSGATGGASSHTDAIQFTGAPSGWNSTINSARMSAFGASGVYELAWRIATDPAATTWIVGLGLTETNGDWRDVDYGFRNSNGALTVYESGTWRSNVAPLKSGDRLSIAVDGATLEYRVNGVGVFTTSISAGADFYVDTSFKGGPPLELTEFALRLP